MKCHRQIGEMPKQPMAYGADKSEARQPYATHRPVGKKELRQEQQENCQTRREMVKARFGRSTRTLQFVGTPASVADRMGEVADQIGGDGFLTHAFPLPRRSIAEITDGLVPELQKRGLFRTTYEHERFRDNLHSF